jgi:hypothetical protein
MRWNASRCGGPSVATRLPPVWISRSICAGELKKCGVEISHKFRKLRLGCWGREERGEDFCYSKRILRGRQADGNVPKAELSEGYCLICLDSRWKRPSFLR